jgi:hypothetical protein
VVNELTGLRTGTQTAIDARKGVALLIEKTGAGA